MKKIIVGLLFICASVSAHAQSFFHHTKAADRWVDSVFTTLNQDDKIAQLMVLRQSGLKNGKTEFYNDDLLRLFQKYKIGAICIFQGNPYEQALNLNRLQSASAIPLMVCVDGETGLGMRMTDSIRKFPDQLTMGALSDTKLIYAVGKAIGEQCKRMGIQVNYAPVVDINNNPMNPIIGYRSFGQDKYLVAKYGIAITEGMQDQNVMACAKHFPGHGDVSVDSHLDLPVINKSLASLDTLELYPFKKMFKAGVGSVMIAHLSIPAIDSTPHLATSLSPKNVNGLLRDQLHYEGLTFTDALEMKGVAKFFPQGQAAVQSLIAGNDMLCLPGDIDNSIEMIKTAISDGRISQASLDNRVKKVLLAKYHLGLNHAPIVSSDNVTSDLNAHVDFYRTRVADGAMTLVSQSNKSLLPMVGKKIAYVVVGNGGDSIASLFANNNQAAIFHLPFSADQSYVDALKQQLAPYSKVVLGMHGASKRPAHNFGLSTTIVNAVTDLSSASNTLLAIFGNPYILENFQNAANSMVAYEDDNIFQAEAYKAMTGQLKIEGHLPVSVGKFHFGEGLKKKSLTIRK